MIFGPYISDNAVPLRPHADRVAKVPNIILSGSEGALGEWCFALNNGSMPEEPVMLAAVLLGDGRSRDRDRVRGVADRQGVPVLCREGVCRRRV